MHKHDGAMVMQKLWKGRLLVETIGKNALHAKTQCEKMRLTIYIHIYHMISSINSLQNVVF